MYDIITYSMFIVFCKYDGHGLLLQPQPAIPEIRRLDSQERSESTSTIDHILSLSK